MFSDFISLIFPNYCVSCQKTLVKGEQLVCVDCLFKLPKTNSHKENLNFVATKFYGKIPLKDCFAFYLFSKTGRVQRIIHALKYGRTPELGEMFGSLFAELLIKETNIKDSYDIIIPIPLHESKLKQRGYNQSEQIAIGLSKVTEIPIQQNVIRRVRKTSTQTRKSRVERWQNVDNIFELTEPSMVKNRRILIVDDVITTGATIESCALALIQAGCGDLGVVALAAAK